MIVIPERRPVRSKVGAQKAAESVAARLGDHFPVDPSAIAGRLGVTVIAGPATDSGLSGAFVLRDGKAAIIYNREHSSVRRRFTIAHELGHFLLHSKEGEEAVLFRDHVSSMGTDVREVHANAFAAALLMPERLLKQVVPEPIPALDAKSIKSVAKRFEVSVEALTYRLSDLDLYTPLY